MALPLELNHWQEGDLSARSPAGRVTETRRQVAEEVWRVSATYLAVQPDIDELRIKLDRGSQSLIEGCASCSRIEAILHNIFHTSTALYRGKLAAMGCVAISDAAWGNRSLLPLERLQEHICPHREGRAGNASA
jgi:hypothetical protein